MLDSLRYKIGRFALNRKAKTIRREKVIFNFQSARKIAVIFKTNSKEEFELVKNFIYYLMEEKNEIVAIGYLEDKKIPDYYNTPIGCHFFTKSDLNFFLMPKTPYILDFINMPYDILIDLSTEFCSPIDYICNLSLAKFKIGRYQKDNSCYDLMIDVNKTNNLQTLINQIKHYVPIFCESVN